MMRMLIMLPSGSERMLSRVTFSPAEGATVSKSKDSISALNIAARAFPCSLFSSARRSSRLLTSPAAVRTIAPNRALMRGSMRGSSAIFEAMTFYSLGWLRRFRLFVLQRPPHAFRRRRHIDMYHTQCVADRAHHRRQGTDRARFAAPLGTQRVRF